MKSPSFQFYAQDFLTGVIYLTNEEIGMYVKMLAKQWTDEKIPKKRLGFLVGCEWDNLSDELKSKFKDCDEYVINERLEVERNKKIVFLNKQKENGKKGGRPKKKGIIKNPSKSQKKPLEEEDEYEIEVDYDNIKIKRKEKIKLVEKYSLRGYNFMIDKLSNYKLSSGKKYKSDYGAINSWVYKRWEEEKDSNSKGKKRDAMEMLMEKHNLNGGS